MLWWDFKSVVTEELIFRGALLLILIRRIQTKKAILFSAIAFGVYHWFSFGIFGNPIPMFFVFVGTGLMGYSLALSFSKTKSMFMPIGLHLGWNFTFNSVFSKGPLGDGLILSTEGIMISDWYSLIGLWFTPIIVLLFVKTFIKRDKDELVGHDIVTSPKKEIV
jgi:membrane protease YdiL (CAAX protease family)